MIYLRIENFENLVCDLFNKKYSPYDTFFIYRTNSQGQYGIDIISLQHQTVIQCKFKDEKKETRVKRQKALLTDLKKEFSNALSFSQQGILPKFKRFIIASNFPKDGIVQDATIALSNSDISVEFFNGDMIYEMLHDVKYKEITKKYYPEVFSEEQFTALTKKQDEIKDQIAETQKVVKDSKEEIKAQIAETQKIVKESSEEIKVQNAETQKMISDFEKNMIKNGEKPLEDTEKQSLRGIKVRHSFSGYLTQAKKYQKMGMGIEAEFCARNARKFIKSSKDKEDIDEFENDIIKLGTYANLKSKGDDFYNQGIFKTALEKYKEAKRLRNTIEIRNCVSKAEQGIKSRKKHANIGKFVGVFALLIICYGGYFSYNQVQNRTKNDLDFQKYMKLGERVLQINPEILKKDPIFYDSAVFYFGKAKELNQDDSVVKKLDFATNKREEYIKNVKLYLSRQEMNNRTKKKEKRYEIKKNANGYMLIKLKKESEKFGYMNKDTVLVIYPKYIDAKPFEKDGTALVKTTEGWFKIDIKETNLGKIK